MNYIYVLFWQGAPKHKGFQGSLMVAGIMPEILEGGGVYHGGWALAVLRDVDDTPMLYFL